MRQFLQQGLNESAPLKESIDQLMAVVPERRAPDRQKAPPGGQRSNA
jgi:flagellum-specific ATP synthase